MNKLVLLFLTIVLPFSLLQADNTPTCGNDGPTKPKCPPDPNVGDPIDAYRGNLHREVEDIRTFGPVPVTFERLYNSRTTDFNDAYWQLGYKQTWQHNWNYEVRQLTSKTLGFFDIKVRYPDGNDYNFKVTDSTGAQLAPAADNGDRLYRWSGSTVGYTLVSTSGRELDFKRYLSPKFALMQKRDGQGGVWTCGYDSTWRLTSITNNFGRGLQIAYGAGSDGVSRISTVTSTDGRTLTYIYSPWASTGHDVLSGVSYPGGESANYTYVTADPTFTSARPQMATASDPMVTDAGSRVKYAYNYNQVFDYGYGAYLVTGTVLEERSLVSNQMIVSLPNGTGPNPVILGGDGASLVRGFANGLQNTYADGAGQTTTYTRGAGGFGFLTSATEAGTGATTQFTRDYAGRLLSATDPLGHTSNRTYNSKGFVLTETDANNHTTTYTRDTNSLITRKDYPDGTYETWTYNSNAQPLTHRQQNGGIETRVYYATNETGGLPGDLKTRTDALGNVISYMWHPSGLLASFTDQRGNITSETYDWRGQLLARTFADGAVVSWTYDQFGNKLTATNELGHTTTWTYSEYNRPFSVTDPLGRTTSYEYGLEAGCSTCSYFGTVSKITSPGGKVTEFTYDHGQKRTSQTVGAGTSAAATTQYAYNNVGDQISLTDPRGKVWQMTYDLGHRMTSRIDPMGNGTDWTYDNVGNVLTITRPDNGVTTHTYDSMDRALTTIDPKAQTTTFTYLPDSSLGSLKDARNNTYTFTVDLLSRRTRMTYPDGSYEAWIYNDTASAGQVATVYRARNATTMACTLDQRNRDLLCDWSDSTPDVVKTYDSAGRLLTLNNSVSELTYTYDMANQLTSETQHILADGAPKSVTYAYDSDGQRSTLTYPSGTVVAYSYTPRSQMANVTVDGPPPMATYGYDLNNNRISKSLENGTSATYSYDDANRLTSLDHKRGPTSFAKFDYALNAVGNRKEKMMTYSGTSNVTEKYSYDAIDQLTGVDYGISGHTTGFGYDSAGNRTTVTDSAGVIPANYTANSLNQYTTVDATTPTYDTSGNLSGYNGWTYTYDGKNRLLSAINGTTLASFTYDSQNRQASRTINGVTTFFTWDGWNLIEERNQSDAELRRYIHGAGSDEILAMIDNSAVQFYHFDGLGSTVALTDSNGTIAECYLYDAFGLPTVLSPTFSTLAVSAANNRFLFTGREWIGEIELYDYRSRCYSAKLGRFLQPDPVKFAAGDSNVYRYVGNAPTSRIDPLGLAALLDEDRRSGSRLLIVAFGSSRVSVTPSTSGGAVRRCHSVGSMTPTMEDGVLLRTDTRGRVRTPVERREALLDEFERSGLSAAKFAELMGVKDQTFASWRQKRLRRQKTGEEDRAGREGVRWLEAVVEDRTVGHPERGHVF